MTKPNAISASAAYKILKKHNGDYIAAAEEVGLKPKQLQHSWYKRFSAGDFVDKGEAAVRLDESVRSVAANQSEKLTAHRTKKTNAKLRKSERDALNLADFHQDLKHAISNIKPIKPYKTKVNKKRNKSKLITMEVLLSDWHLGKKTTNYNSEIAVLNLEKYANKVVIMAAREQPDEIYLVILGDMIENSMKHIDSLEGCDSTMVEQIATAAQAVVRFILRLSEIGVPIHVVSVAGNHENIGHGSKMNFRGRQHVSHIIYEMARTFTSDVIKSWNKPDGCYAQYEIQGNTIVCEHGDETTNTEQAMRLWRGKRSEQIGKMATGWRQGDKHCSVVADGGYLVCNGAFVSEWDGTDYNSAKGYTCKQRQVVAVWTGGNIVRVEMVDVS